MTIAQVKQMIARYSERLRRPDFLKTISYHVDPHWVGEHIFKKLYFTRDQRFHYVLYPRNIVCLQDCDASQKLGRFSIPNFFKEHSKTAKQLIKSLYFHHIGRPLQYTP